MQNERKSKEFDTTQSPRWPLLLRISPKALLIAVLVWLVLAWAIFIAVDILRLIDLGIPLWRHLFNDRPVEWSQWFILAFAIVAAAYLAGRLYEDHAMVSRFFFLLAIGMGLMFIEETGDIRHAIAGYTLMAFGPEVFGLSYVVVSNVPYFAALSAVPLYAVLGYSRYAWKSVRMRFYLVSGVMLYALAAISSGIRHLGDFYSKLGAWVDAIFFGNRFPVPDGMSQRMAHYFIMDAPIEESVELVAAAMLFATILAFAGDMRSWQKRESIDVRREM